MTELKGITWNHSRGLLPMLATAQRFAEIHPELSIQWEKRSLQAFADASLSRLAAEFDLLVIDHPSIGEAAAQNLLLPLDDLLDAGFLRDQAENSAGGSHASYRWGGKQWALAIDAAAPIAGWRADLLTRAGTEPPETWEELLALARRGLVSMPALAIDSLMHLFMLLNALGDEPFARLSSETGSLCGEDTFTRAVQMLRELVELADLAAPGSRQRNPIGAWELLASSGGVAYCPFAYGYSNYSRSGYAAHLITTGGLVSFGGRPLRSTLGGAGLAISAHCRRRESAAAYARYVAAGETQRSLYFTSGGQPGHRSAWTDEETNRIGHEFFSRTLPTVDAAWVRPRWPGFIAFQDRAAALLHGYLQHGGGERELFAEINRALQPHRSAAEACS